MTLYSSCGCRDNHAVKMVMVKMVKMVKKHNLKHRVLQSRAPDYSFLIIQIKLFILNNLT